MQSPILPDPGRMAQVRAEMRERLHTSMHHLLFEVFADDEPKPISHAGLRALITQGEGFPGPAVFALHALFLDAALRDDKSHLPKALRILAEFEGRTLLAPETMRVDPFCADHVPPDDLWLLQRVFADDIGLTARLSPPSAAQTQDARGLLREAMRVLEDLTPDWGTETRQLASQVYLAMAGDPERQRFKGAAAFDAFGAILLNPCGLVDLPSTLMALVHESAHQQVFLFHLDDPVILNPPSDTFGSPLRSEPRPMEGIFHAMWVSGRMVLAAHAVLQAAPGLAWAHALHRQQADALRAFCDCEATVEKHASLTDFGRELFQSARTAVHAI